MVGVGLVVSALASLAFAAPCQPGVNYWFSLWVSLYIALGVSHSIPIAQR